MPEKPLPSPPSDQCHHSEPPPRHLRRQPPFFLADQPLAMSLLPEKPLPPFRHCRSQACCPSPNRPPRHRSRRPPPLSPSPPSSSPSPELTAAAALRRPPFFLSENPLPLSQSPVRHGPQAPSAHLLPQHRPPWPLPVATISRLPIIFSAVVPPPIPVLASSSSQTTSRPEIHAASPPLFNHHGHCPELLSTVASIHARAPSPWPSANYEHLPKHGRPPFLHYRRLLPVPLCPKLQPTGCRLSRVFHDHRLLASSIFFAARAPPLLLPLHLPCQHAAESAWKQESEVPESQYNFILQRS